MTLSRQMRSRVSVFDEITQRGGTLSRLVIVGGALVAAGLVAPGAALADEATFDPPTQNERSIMLIESKEAPGEVLAGGMPAFTQTANGRSIALIESKEAPGGVLAGSVPDTVRYGAR